MGLIFFFIIIVIVLILLAINYEKNKLEKKKEDYLNQDVYVLGQKLKVRDFQNIDSKRLKEKTEALKQENKRISDRQDYYFAFVKKAKVFEKNKDHNKAIVEYEKALEYAYSEPILKIHNYAFSIHRLIILYGKTKRKEKLKEHLEFSIEKHPNWRDIEDWKKRLNKL